MNHSLKIEPQSEVTVLRTEATLTGTYNNRESWEKSSVYDLSNGVRAFVSFSHYGEMISRLEDSEGDWHCSNGNKTIPARFSFALAWLEPYLPQITDKLMRPRFKRIYKKVA